MKHSFFLCAFLLLFSSLAPAYDRFEVKTFDGVPMITLDGVPTRSRIFWGRPGGIVLNLTPEFQTFEFELDPSEDARGIGTMHFRFGNEPGEIVLDDCSVVEKATGKQIAGPYHFETQAEFLENWKFWHDRVGETTIATLGVEPGCGVNGSGGLKVTILPGNENARYDFHVYHQWRMDLKPGHVYTVRLTMRSDPPRRVRTAFYRPENPHVSLGGVGGVLTSQTRMAADVGVDFVSFMIEGLWPEEDGTIDFTGMDAQIDAILKANPNALIIPRFPLDVRSWWLRKNPDERMVWFNFDHKAPYNYGTQWATPCSLVYRQAACETLRAAIRHLEAKYGNSIAGYHPAGQNTQEWFTINTWTGGHADYSPAAQKGFRLWLKEKYKTDAALQKAWGKPDVTLETASVPSGELRDESLKFYVIDPDLNPDVPREFQSIVDFNEFFNRQMTETILALARVVKEETQGKKLSVFFYGYCWEFSGCAKGPAASAHYDLRTILDSPDIDLIASPMSYFERQPGGGGSCMLNAESVTAAGKIYVYEDDTRTWLAKGSTAPGWESGADTYEETREVLLRNTAESALRNFGIWWMDLGGAGWFNSAQLWKIMDELKPMDEYFLKNPTPYRPEVAVFVDEISMQKVGNGRFSHQSVGRLRLALNRLGTPYGQYMLDDLLSGRVAPPKVTLVTNCAALTPEQKAKIGELTQKAGSKLIWVPQEGFAPEALREAVSAGTDVHFWTQEPCNVWANGPFVLLHAPADGEYHLNVPENARVQDVITGEPVPTVIPMKKAQTRILKVE